MTPRRRKQSDPFEQAIEAALSPGIFISYTAEPLACKLERSYPDMSARVYCALCLRVINAGKSKYFFLDLFR